MGVPERLLVGSIQKYDFVLDPPAVQIQLKLEPRILRVLSKSIVKSAQLNDRSFGTIIFN
jgi:hypothetical protein